MCLECLRAREELGMSSQCACVCVQQYRCVLGVYSGVVYALCRA